MKSEDIILKLLSGSKNVKFREIEFLLESLGFSLVRTKGSHHIFKKSGVPEMINIQNFKGEVKPYQIKQILALIEKYSLFK
jgi:predicted RNA binding protein YcfA (HicA-like mRNA interferase family)